MTFNLPYNGAFKIFTRCVGETNYGLAYKGLPTEDDLRCNTARLYYGYSRHKNPPIKNKD